MRRRRKEIRGAGHSGLALKATSKEGEENADEEEDRSGERARGQTRFNQEWSGRRRGGGGGDWKRRETRRT